MDTTLQPAVISDARRRQRRRRLGALVVLALAVAAVAAYLFAGRGGNGTPDGGQHAVPRARLVPPLPPTHSGGTLTMVIGASDDPAPFVGNLPIFERHRTAADTLLPQSPEGPPYAAHGELLPETNRAVDASPQPFSVYLTSEHYVCATGSSWSSCLPPLDRKGVSWSVHNYGNTSYFFVGAAAPDVERIDLVYDTGRRQATLSEGLFWVDWPALVSLDTFSDRDARFEIHYSDSRPTATVALN
jgi:hypothetical protein